MCELGQLISLCLNFLNGNNFKTYLVGLLWDLSEIHVNHLQAWNSLSHPKSVCERHSGNSDLWWSSERNSVQNKGSDLLVRSSSGNLILALGWRPPPKDHGDESWTWSTWILIWALGITPRRHYQPDLRNLDNFEECVNNGRWGSLRCAWGRNTGWKLFKFHENYELLFLKTFTLEKEVQLFASDNIVLLEKPNESTKKLLELVAGYKANVTKNQSFHTF